jgi:hypothetical protein
MYTVESNEAREAKDRAYKDSEYLTNTRIV